jgi:hypothetical protein
VPQRGNKALREQRREKTALSSIEEPGITEKEQCALRRHELCNQEHLFLPIIFYTLSSTKLEIRAK